MFTSIRKNFITGVAVILPALITIWLVKFAVVKTNYFLLEPIADFLRPFILDSTILEYIAKVLTLVFLVVIISLIGFGTRILFLRKFFSFWEKNISQLPMIGKIYGAIKEMSHAILGQSKSIFTRVVLVAFPRPGIYAIGFVTYEGKGELQDKTVTRVTNVFVPTSPNPTSGFLLLVPEKEMIKLDMSVEEGLKLVISGGIVPLPERVKIKKKDGDTDN
ncbi:MAG: DUF502 domain-containing protein [Candidatus Omnitrophica bacterium]|nr:DUF502 domain-containing protein [Candidatus Omnitrophota bacterium]MDD5545774.1 DUF502 domain-containing protein [Candidatus Omnitrophota bacterium]